MDDNSEITVEWHGNRFRLADNPRDGKFSMVGIREDIPHYISKLQEIAPAPEKAVQELFRRHVYLPVSESVIAVQWDGTRETYTYISALCNMRNCEATMSSNSKTIKIATRGDYQGGINYTVGDWAVFEPFKNHVTYNSNESFHVRYIKVPLEG